ncbi:MAG: hypothetical protein MEQ74_01000 [Paracoccus sp.]|nr:hypothetical protein [Paracoccus sp. (in: a-proteobacteria)]
MSEKANAVASFFLDEAKKWLARMSLMGMVAALLFLFTPIKDRIAQIWHSPDLLQQVIQKIDQLAIEVNRANGEDRVIFESVGQSYVREPVHIGDQITLNLVIRLTKLGSGCTLMNQTGIFSDETGIAHAGVISRPVRQITTSEAEMRMILDVPTIVRPGRATVYLSLEFDCNGKTVFDATRPVAFALLPEPAGVAP